MIIQCFCVFVESASDEEGSSDDLDLSEDERLDEVVQRAGADGDSDESEDERYLKELLDRVTANDEADEDADDDELEEDLFHDADSETDFDFKASDIGARDVSKNRARKRKTEVDDRFFKMADMEEFLEQEDAREERRIAQERGDVTQDDQSDEDDVDYFGEGDSSGDEVSNNTVIPRMMTLYTVLYCNFRLKDHGLQVHRFLRSARRFEES